MGECYGWELRARKLKQEAISGATAHSIGRLIQPITATEVKGKELLAQFRP
jgi:hypothetical protein